MAVKLSFKLMLIKRIQSTHVIVLALQTIGRICQSPKPKTCQDGGVPTEDVKMSLFYGFIMPLHNLIYENVLQDNQ